MNPRETVGRLESKASRFSEFDTVVKSLDRVRRSVKMCLAERVLSEYNRRDGRLDFDVVMGMARRSSECLEALNQASDALMG